MVEVKYHRKAVWVHLIVLIAFVLFGIGFWYLIKGPRVFSPVPLILVAAIFLTAPIRMLMSDGVAFRADRSALIVSGIWGKRRFAWSDVADIDLIRVTTASHGKPSPGGGTVYLCFKIARRLRGQKEIRLDYGLFDLPSGNAFDLVEDIRKLKQAAAPGPTGYYADAPRSDGFDPDAIMARYMQNRDKAEPVAPAPAAKPSFGRKGT